MRPEPVFQAPWHAQLFALTVHLNEAGHFNWPEWTERFGATLAWRGAARTLNGGDDYFMAWLETLEGLLADRHLANPQQIDDLRSAWQAAYLATPHGQPVKLG